MLRESRLGLSDRESFMPRHQWPGVTYDGSSPVPRSHLAYTRMGLVSRSPNPYACGSNGLQTGHSVYNTVKHPNKGHIGDRPFVPCRRVVPSRRFSYFWLRDPVCSWRSTAHAHGRFSIDFELTPFVLSSTFFFWTKNSVQYLWIWRNLLTNALYDGQCRAWWSQYRRLL